MDFLHHNGGRLGADYLECFLTIMFFGVHLLLQSCLSMGGGVLWIWGSGIGYLHFIPGRSRNRYTICVYTWCEQSISLKLAAGTLHQAFSSLVKRKTRADSSYKLPDMSI